MFRYYTYNKNSKSINNFKLETFLFKTGTYMLIDNNEFNHKIRNTCTCLCHYTVAMLRFCLESFVYMFHTLRFKMHLIYYGLS